MAKSPAELYEEREKRLRDAAALREPDRVPFLFGVYNFVTKYTGVPTSTAYYDHAKWKEAMKKTIVDFEPDLFRPALGVNAGVGLEVLGTKVYKWAGFNLEPNSSPQFVEGEYMKEDEYDHFLSDPGDFTFRKYLPRAYSTLEPLAKLPPLRNLQGLSIASTAAMFATPEFRKVFDALIKAGEEEQKRRKAFGDFEEEMALLGFPAHSTGGGVGGAPFDSISDNLRGMRGAMIDMYRRPEQLLAACDAILNSRIANAVPADPKKRGNPKRVFMALHRGDDTFMNLKQFEKFYWPGLKKAIVTNVELGFLPMPFFEGQNDSRLEYLLELPKGKVVIHLTYTDTAKAKAVLGNHLCIMCSVPASLLQVGSPQEVEEYARKLIEVGGKGGGFILTNGTADYAKPENIKAMADAVRKYGRY